MRNYNLFLAIFLATLIGANILFLKSTIFGGFLGLAYIILIGRGFSNLYNSPHTFLNFTYGVFTALAGLSLIGAIIYKFYNLSDIVVIAILNLFLIVPSFIRKIPVDQKAEKINQPKFDYLYLTLPVFFTAWLVFILAISATSEALRSPWEVIPVDFWYVQFLFWLSLATGIIKLSGKNNTSILTLLFGIGLFNLYSVAQIIYQINYGFDPFIHQATEKLIANTGAVYPKPWYYLGQYSLVVLLHKLTFLPIFLIDKWLILVASVFTLPTIAYASIKKFLGESSATNLTALFLILIPATFFIATTPQSLANLGLLILVMLAMAYTLPIYLLAFIAITITAIHPIAGIPALFITVIYFLQSKQTKYKHWLTAMITIIAIPIIPILFWLQNKQNNFNIQTFALPGVSLDKSIFYLQNSYNFILDSIYILHWNGFLILCVLLLAGIFIAYKQSKTSLIPHLALIVYLFGNWLLLSKFIPFDFLINYERAIFADRFLDLIIIAGIPFIALSAFYFFKRALNINMVPVTQYLVLSLAILATISVYNLYPRVDEFATSRGYSTSSADIEAVRYIHTDATGQDYVVLGNQAVSAGALKQLGFYKYYDRQDIRTGEQIFFYPIPTGGSLYQIYLEMVYDSPTRAVAEKAMNLTGADTVYFVLNDYWFNSENLNDIALTEADNHWQIENHIFIYKFEKK